MTVSTPIPLRIILLNVALVAIWLPLFVVARNLLEKVAAASPSDDLMWSASAAVIGTLIIVSATYIFGIVLINKFMTQNVEGLQSRVGRRVALIAVVVYVVAGIVAFT